MKRRESPWLKAVAIAVVRPVMALLTRPTWRGREHIPRQGGVIVAANHLSMVDPLTVAHFLYVHGRRWPTFTAKEGVFRIPVVGAAVRKLGQIPVHRGSSDAVRALHEAEEALTGHGSAVIFYPEGTCTRDPDLWPMVAKTGVARLALRTGVPVVPVAHWGEQHLLPYGSKRPRLLPRKRVQVTAGEPVDLSAYRDRPMSATTLREATAEIMTAITDLQARIRGERPPLEPYDPRKARGQAVESGDGEKDTR